jgi:hypothetical protein
MRRNSGLGLCLTFYQLLEPSQEEVCVVLQLLAIR